MGATGSNTFSEVYHWNFKLQRTTGYGYPFFATIQLIKWDPDNAAQGQGENAKIYVDTHPAAALGRGNEGSFLKYNNGVAYWEFLASENEKEARIRVDNFNAVITNPTEPFKVVQIKVKSYATKQDAEDGRNPIDDDVQTAYLTTESASTYYLKFAPCSQNAREVDKGKPWSAQNVNSEFRYGGTAGGNGDAVDADNCWYLSDNFLNINTQNLQYLKIVDDDWAGARKPVVGDIFKSDICGVIARPCNNNTTTRPTASQRNSQVAGSIGFRECYKITEYLTYDDWKDIHTGTDDTYIFGNGGNINSVDHTTIDPKGVNGRGPAMFKAGRFNCDAGGGGPVNPLDCIGEETMDKEHHLSEKLMASLMQMGWGEGIGGFEATGFSTVVSTTEMGQGLDGSDMAQSVQWTKMTGYGHSRVHLASLPGTSSNYSWQGEAKWEPGLTPDGIVDMPVVDSVSVYYMFNTAASSSFDFFSRYKQQIDIEVNKVRNLDGSQGDTLQYTISAWDPEYKKIFIEKTFRNSASLTVGGKINEVFNFGISMSLSESTNQGVDGYENPTSTTSRNISCRAFVTWQDLLTYASGSEESGDGSWSDAVSVEIDLGAATQTITRKMSHFIRDPQTRKIRHATATERAFRLTKSDGNAAVVREGQNADGNVIDAPPMSDIFLAPETSGDNFKDTLFDIQSISINYDLKSNNGWAINCALNRDADGEWSVDPSVSYSSEIPGWENVVYSLDWNPTKSSPGLSLAYRSDELLSRIGQETVFGRPMKMYLNAGISVSEIGAVKKFEPSWSFAGTYGSPGGNSIFDGFQYDINIQRGVLAISNAVNIYQHSNEAAGEKTQLSWGIDASLGDVTNPFWGGPVPGASGIDPNWGISVGLDGVFEKNIAEFGDVWGKLILRSTFTAGLRAGRNTTGGSGMTGGTVNAGVYVGVAIEWDNNILGWLKFPLNVVPGFGAAFGWNFVLRAKSTYGGSVTGSQYVMALGPVTWNLKPVDKLREHLQRVRQPWVENIPFIGSILAGVPIVGALGPLENEIQYMARAGTFRAFACLGAAAQDCNEVAKNAFQTIWRAIVANQRAHNPIQVLPCLACAYDDEDDGPQAAPTARFIQVPDPQDPSIMRTELEIEIPANFYKYSTSRQSNYWFKWNTSDAREKARLESDMEYGTINLLNYEHSRIIINASDALPGSPGYRKFQTYLGGDRWRLLMGVQDCTGYPQCRLVDGNSLFAPTNSNNAAWHNRWTYDKMKWRTRNKPCNCLRASYDKFTTAEHFQLHDLNSFPELDGNDGYITTVLETIDDHVYGYVMDNCHENQGTYWEEVLKAHAVSKGEEGPAIEEIREAYQAWEDGRDYVVNGVTYTGLGGTAKLPKNLDYSNDDFRESLATAISNLWSAGDGGGSWKHAGADLDEVEGSANRTGWWDDEGEKFGKQAMEPVTRDDARDGAGCMCPPGIAPGRSAWTWIKSVFGWVDDFWGWIVGFFTEGVDEKSPPVNPTNECVAKCIRQMIIADKKHRLSLVIEVFGWLGSFVKFGGGRCCDRVGFVDPNKPQVTIEETDCQALYESWEDWKAKYELDIDRWWGVTQCTEGDPEGGPHWDPTGVQGCTSCFATFKAGIAQGRNLPMLNAPKDSGDDLCCYTKSYFKLWKLLTRKARQALSRLDLADQEHKVIPLSLRAKSLTCKKAELVGRDVDTRALTSTGKYHQPSRKELNPVTTTKWHKTAGGATQDDGSINPEVDLTCISCPSGTDENGNLLHLPNMGELAVPSEGHTVGPKVLISSPSTFSPNAHDDWVIYNSTGGYCPRCAGSDWAYREVKAPSDYYWHDEVIGLNKSENFKPPKYEEYTGMINKLKGLLRQRMDGALHALTSPEFHIVNDGNVSSYLEEEDTTDPAQSDWGLAAGSYGNYKFYKFGTQATAITEENIRNKVSPHWMWKLQNSGAPDGPDNFESLSEMACAWGTIVRRMGKIADDFYGIKAGEWGSVEQNFGKLMDLCYIFYKRAMNSSLHGDPPELSAIPDNQTWNASVKSDANIIKSLAKLTLTNMQFESENLIEAMRRIYLVWLGKEWRSYRQKEITEGAGVYSDTTYNKNILLGGGYAGYDMGGSLSSGGSRRWFWHRFNTSEVMGSSKPIHSSGSFSSANYPDKFSYHVFIQENGMNKNIYTGAARTPTRQEILAGWHGYLNLSNMQFKNRLDRAGTWRTSWVYSTPTGGWNAGPNPEYDSGALGYHFGDMLYTWAGESSLNLGTNVDEAGENYTDPNIPGVTKGRSQLAKDVYEMAARFSVGHSWGKRCGGYDTPLGRYRVAPFGWKICGMFGYSGAAAMYPDLLKRVFRRHAQLYFGRRITPYTSGQDYGEGDTSATQASPASPFRIPLAFTLHGGLSALERYYEFASPTLNNGEDFDQIGQILSARQFIPTTNQSFTDPGGPKMERFGRIGVFLGEWESGGDCAAEKGAFSGDMFEGMKLYQQLFREYKFGINAGEINSAGKFKVRDLASELGTASNLGSLKTKDNEGPYKQDAEGITFDFPLGEANHLGKLGMADDDDRGRTGGPGLGGVDVYSTSVYVAGQTQLAQSNISNSSADYSSGVNCGCSPARLDEANWHFANAFGGRSEEKLLIASMHEFGYENGATNIYAGGPGAWNYPFTLTNTSGGQAAPQGTGSNSVGPGKHYPLSPHVPGSTQNPEHLFQTYVNIPNTSGQRRGSITNPYSNIKSYYSYNWYRHANATDSYGPKPYAKGFRVSRASSRSDSLEDNRDSFPYIHLKSEPSKSDVTDAYIHAKHSFRPLFVATGYSNSSAPLGAMGSFPRPWTWAFSNVALGTCGQLRARWGGPNPSSIPNLMGYLMHSTTGTSNCLCPN